MILLANIYRNRVLAMRYYDFAFRQSRDQVDSLMWCFLVQDGSCEAYTATSSSTSGIRGKKQRNYAGGELYTRYQFSLSLVLLSEDLISR